MTSACFSCASSGAGNSSAAARIAKNPPYRLILHLPEKNPAYSTPVPKTEVVEQLQIPQKQKKVHGYPSAGVSPIKTNLQGEEGK
jgi:hypothetical protein